MVDKKQEKQTLAQKLAKIAKDVQEDSTGIHDMAKLMYAHIIEVAEASAACGKTEVRMSLVYPEMIKTPKAISTTNKKICAMLDADGFSGPYVSSNKEGIYELRFDFKE